MFVQPADGSVSRLYLTGVSNRSFFDARTIYCISYPEPAAGFDHLSGVDYQRDNSPIFGGEVSYRTNFTNLTRNDCTFTEVARTRACARRRPPIRCFVPLAVHPARRADTTCA